MRLFFVNLFARDDGQTRDLPFEEAVQKPYRCFTYAVLADNAKQAEEIITEHNDDMIAIGWTDLFCYAQDTKGTECAKAVYVGSSDVRGAEALTIKKNNNK